MSSEFDIIRRFFSPAYQDKSIVALAGGDDCALLTPTSGMQIAISSDMLVQGRHFFDDADAKKLGHKSLAVNLSDLAAMGAKPVGFTLALSLPHINEVWLANFSEGLLALAATHNCQLIGGDTTKGPLNICITIFGETPIRQALRRDAAQINDDIWVTGSLGDARLGLATLQNKIILDAQDLQQATKALHEPVPRIALGILLRNIAHAAIDISDGLIGDLSHILQKSHCGATINVDNIPVGKVLTKQTRAMQREFALSGGDDYELCFTAPQKNRDAILHAAHTCDTPITRIGKITAQTSGLQFIDTKGDKVSLSLSSFDHFSSP